MLCPRFCLSTPASHTNSEHATEYVINFVTSSLKYYKIAHKNVKKHKFSSSMYSLKRTAHPVLFYNSVWKSDHLL